MEECTTLIQSIRQMQKSIDYDADDQTLRITLPLTHCRQVLEEKMKHTTSLHAARFEQVIGTYTKIYLFLSLWQLINVIIPL